MPVCTYLRIRAAIHRAAELAAEPAGARKPATGAPPAGGGNR